jgi:ATP-dependent helicase/DNAse subunit B
MMHEILERFIGLQLALPRQRRIRPMQPWSPDDHARMAEIADQVFKTFEDRGLVGRQLLWDLARTTIERELHRFLILDDQYRAEGGWIPERVELEFGPGHGRPVELRLPDGRTVNFRGYVDRVDMATDGSLSVTDYKTGFARDVDGLAGDPVLNGRKLQLPLYGLAARSRIGDGPVRVAYWFVSDKGNFTPIAYQLDQPVLDRFGEVVSVLVDGIDAGMFPARPGKNDSNCTYCSFQAMCPGNRQDAWARVRRAPGLEDYVALAEDTGATR